MNPVLAALLAGTLGGPLGGLAAAWTGAAGVRRHGKRRRGATLSFAAGFILAVAFQELLARGVEQAKGWGVLIVLSGIAAGAAMRAVMELPFGAPRRVALSLAVVNVVEGLTIGIGFAVGTGLGFLLLAVMVFENYMEGISIAAESERADSTGKLVLLTTAPTATLGLGGALGAYLGGLSPLVLAGLLGVAAGMMLYVVVNEVMYDAHRLGPGAVNSVPFMAGAMLGVLIAALHR